MGEFQECGHRVGHNDAKGSPRIGAFLSPEDPLWYPRRSTASPALDRGSCSCRRVLRGEHRRGTATRVRRLCATYDEGSRCPPSTLGIDPRGRL